MTPLLGLFLHSLTFLCVVFRIFPSYLFLKKTDDTHIFAPSHVVPFAFNRFVF
jgi:hypothetical protein